MDRIVLKNLSFYGYHGVLIEEKKLGQKFYIDLEIYTDLRDACSSDDVNDTINYKLVYDIVKNIVENKKFNLLEKLADEIIYEIFKRFCSIDEIIVRIRKPEAPVNGIFDYFGVELRRRRDEYSLS